MKKILFLCRERIDGYGRSIGLVNSSTFISEYLRSIGYQSKVVTVIDGNAIDREVFNYNPTHIVIEAIWVTPNKIKELVSLARYSRIQWFVRLHSKVPFIATEGIAMGWLAEYQKIEKLYPNFHTSANSKEIVHDLFKVFDTNQNYLPNVYHPTRYKLDSLPTKDPNFLDFGCFGAIRPLKNQLIQAIAAIEYGNDIGKKIRFHVNAERQEQNGDNVYKNIKALFDNSNGHTLVNHNWLKHEDFVKLIVTMDLGLQVSLSETFNIVAADFVWNDVPIIGSPDIDWMSSVMQANPNSSHDIKKKINFVMKTKKMEIYRINSIYLKMYNEKAKAIWRDLLAD